MVYGIDQMINLKAGANCLEELCCELWVAIGQEIIRGSIGYNPMIDELIGDFERRGGSKRHRPFQLRESVGHYQYKSILVVSDR